MNKYFNKEFLLTHKDVLLKAAAIAVLIVAAFVVFVLDSNGDAPALTAEETVPAEQLQEETESASEDSSVVQATEDTTEATMIFVDISGAVNEPMVTELPQGSRVADAISAAGGLRGDADVEAVNRAAFLTDGEKIIIPGKGETVQLPSSVPAQFSGSAGLGAGNTDHRVNLNTATVEELQTLNGVGPATAEKIITYREENGRFMKTEELKKVNGIGDKTYEKLKEEITV